MIKAVLTFIFLWSNLAAAADFNFQPEACTVGVTNDVLFEIKEQNFKSNLKVELLFSGSVPLPKLRLTFLQHEPTGASIQWNSIVVERKSQKFIRPEILDRLRAEEAQVFPMKRTSPAGEIAVFETATLDLGRAQDLVALFLSQNEVLVNATTDHGDQWQAKQSLNASDASYRKMAATCFPQLSANYLKPSGERIPMKSEIKGVSPAAIPVSEGYGLTSFTWMQELLPTSILDSKALVTGSADDEKKITELVELFRQKRDAQEIFNRETTNPDYVQLNTQLAEHYDRLTQVYSRFVILTGNSSQATDSLIAQKTQEEARLRQAITDVTAQIEQQNTAKLPLDQEYSSAEQALAPHLQQLATFEQSIADIATKIKDIELLQQHLGTLLQQHQTILGDQVASLGGTVEGPWSVEEIDAKVKENEDRKKQLEVINALKGQIEVIAADAQVLLAKATAQQEASLAYLAAVNQQRVLKGQLSKDEEWLRQNREVPHFTIATEEFFLLLNRSVEEKIALNTAPRNYDTEFETHSALYEKAQGDFLTLVTEARKDGSSLFATVLCNPNVLMDSRNRTKPCLTIDEVLDEKISSQFFIDLPPKELDALLVSVEKPWAQDTSKSQILIDRLQQEISRPKQNMQGMVDAWGTLRHVIWRWVTMQKELAALDACGDAKPTDVYVDKIFTAAFYEKVFACEKTQVQQREEVRNQDLAAVNGTPEIIAQAAAAYDQADAEFASYSDIFMTTAMSKIKEASAQSNFTELFTSCILPMERAEDCAGSLKTSVEESNTKLTQEQATYIDMAKALFMNINTRMFAFSNETSELMRQSEQVQQGKKDYIAQNNVDILISNKEALKNKLAETEKQIADLVQAKEQQVAALSTATQSEAAFREEAKNLIVQIQSVSSQITQLLPSYQPFCSAILPSSEKMRAVDEQIYQLFGISKDTAAVKLYSSCQMPSLDHFVPSNDFLTPTSIQLR
jgi:hypothetical protein